MLHLRDSRGSTKSAGEHQQIRREQHASTHWKPIDATSGSISISRRIAGIRRHSDCRSPPVCRRSAEEEREGLCYDHSCNNTTTTTMADPAMYDDDDHLDGDDGADGGAGGGAGGKGGRAKSRRELPAGAVATLKAWLLSPEHFTHPYPTPQDQTMLMQKTGIDKKQLKNWFTNARRRIWKPMLKKQIEQGKLTPAGAVVPGAIPGLLVHPGTGPAGMPTAAAAANGSLDNPHSIQAMRVHYQQAVQQQATQAIPAPPHRQPQPPQQPQQSTATAASALTTPPQDAYGNPVYAPPPPAPDPAATAVAVAAAAAAAAGPAAQYYVSQPPDPYQQQQQQQQQQQNQPQVQQQQQQQVQQQQQQPPSTAAAPQSQQAPLLSVGSMGTLPQLAPSSTAGAGQLSKTDSHAVLMELFARDQDLVRQATESAKLKAEVKQAQQSQQQQPLQHPGAPPSLHLPPPPPQQVPSQHPMNKTQAASQASAPATSSSGVLHQVPTLNSWPHFSSITSLNNLGTMPGVKSITSLSAADLASKGKLTKKGNLAQVKSNESMGKNDSYAFLEVFFGDRSSTTNLSLLGSSGTSSGQVAAAAAGGTASAGSLPTAGAAPVGQKGKGAAAPGDSPEDNEIGLSLEDESPSQTSKKELTTTDTAAGPAPATTPLPATSASPAPQQQQQQDTASGDGSNTMDSGTLKRAYDDALAARGLISVSRSSEKLTDLVLPPKMQRTLSQEFVNKQQQAQIQTQQQTQVPAQGQSQQQTGAQAQAPYGSFASSLAAPPAASASSTSASGAGDEPGGTTSSAVSHQYPGQQPGEPPQGGQSQQKQPSFSSGGNLETTEGGHVQVSAATACAICNQTNVDTQLRPCGHYFHERCLKPSLQTPMGPPRCPVDNIPMQSALLAVPTDDQQQQQPQPQPPNTQQQQQQQAWIYSSK